MIVATKNLLNYANQYTKPFNEISGVVTEFQNSLACAARVFEFINIPPETEDDTFSLESPEGNIEFLGHLTLAEAEGITPDTADVVQQAHDTL